MKIKEIPIEKTAIQELSGEQLELLSAFSKTDEFTLLKELAESEKYKRYKMDFLAAKSVEEINFFKGINVGIDFIIDSVQRAKEELKSRGVEEDVDNEEELK